jgi:serine/threonine protein kinase
MEGRPTSDRGSDHIIANSQSTACIPHVLDLIVLANDVKRSGKAYIPEIYLQPQAVDSAKRIGEGASFLASVQKLPSAEPVVGLTLDMGRGLMVTAKSKPRNTPSFIVYKVARVQFEESGEPVREHRRALASVLMELRALTFAPLAEHPNIIDFLGLAWGSNVFNPEHKLPVLVVEYAQHGTLADIQNKRELSSRLQQSICLDIALGIDILHQYGIVHSDIKAENVLIFAHSQKELIAKLADFGFSVVESAEEDMILVGTRDWMAPEAFGNCRIPRNELKLTDVYSFGLLVWVVAMRGQNPFRLLLSGSDRDAEIMKWKKTDSVLQLSKLHNWYAKWFENCKGSEKVADNVFVEESESLSVEPMLELAREDAFYGKLDLIFANCLSLDPSHRDLAKVMETLQPSAFESSRYT